jgi:hypothetical protein
LSEQFFALLLGDLVSMWHLSFSFLNHVWEFYERLLQR